MGNEPHTGNTGCCGNTTWQGHFTHSRRVSDSFSELITYEVRIEVWIEIRQKDFGKKKLEGSETKEIHDPLDNDHVKGFQGQSRVGNNGVHGKPGPPQEGLC